ncbi:MAG: Crp/Fnr family transcriptional regulator [Anaerolineales bacterium]|nr:Crp/Fnr family transcriptional regulator [Anaerolineales bacterium]
MPGIHPNTIRDVDLFRGLTQEQLNRVSGWLYCRAYPVDANIITAEQPGEVVYIVLSGTLKIHIEQANGADVVLAILGPGDVVGEMSLIDSAGRSASVVTLEESQLLWMGKEAFQECMRTMPAISQNLVGILARRVRLANELIQAMATLDVHGRVARQMLAFADKYGEASINGDALIPIRLTQSDIADLVGASRKRVNQVMVTFKQQGYISVDDVGRITVHDRQALARLCR